MKIRKSFITNSSSASFVVQKKFLSPAQINRIKNVIMSKKCYDGLWVIKEYLDRIEGSTDMDNDHLLAIFRDEFKFKVGYVSNFADPKAYVIWGDGTFQDECGPVWIIVE